MQFHRSATQSHRDALGSTVLLAVADEEFVARAKQSKLAVQVKVADIEDILFPGVSRE